MIKKGIILAGGSGTRLSPLTKSVNKQLLPIHDKPMIFYPLSVLVDAGINDIMIITTKEHEENFKKLLGYGEEWSVKLTYKIQDKPEGIAQSLILSEKWSKDSQIVLILGDNLFFGPNLNQTVKDGIENNSGATIFCIESNNPERFGVIEFDNYPDWITREEMDYYIGEFEGSGMRGPLNRYRAQEIDFADLAEFKDQKLKQPAAFITGSLDPVNFFVGSGYKDSMDLKNQTSNRF